MPKNKKKSAKKEEEDEEEQEETEDKEEDKEAEDADDKTTDAKSEEKTEKGAGTGGYPSAEPAKSEEAPTAPPGPLQVEFKPHDSFPPMTSAVEVVYCPIDGLPPDFCQYGPMWEKSKPWCLENAPEYYPELSGVSLEDAKKKADEANEKSKIKELPGGKLKKAKEPEITIKKLSRGGRKCVTSVCGLDSFGIKLDDVAKLFKKKFACGCAVVKADSPVAPDTVDIQGDFEQEVIDIIVDTWKEVPLKKITVLDGGSKKGGKR